MPRTPLVGQVPETPVGQKKSRSDCPGFKHQEIMSTRDST